jgi:DNA primase
LGTALTENQIAALWRVVPEPTLCFDGDRAGKAAAYRAAERAVPLLKPGHSLQFVMLPEGEDPDSLVRNQGRSAMDELLSRPVGLSELLWSLLTEGKIFDTPERRAGLEAEFGRLTRQILDERVRVHYLRYLRGRLDALLGDRPRQRHAAKGYQAQHRPFQATGSAALRSSKIARHGADSEPRERILILTVLNHPDLLAKVGEELGMIEFFTPELDKLRNEIIRIAAGYPGLDSEALKGQLNQEGCAQLLNRIDGDGTVPPEWFSAPGAALEDAEIGWKIVLNRHRQASLKKQLEEAKIAFETDESSENWDKFSALQRTVQAAEGDEANIEGFGQASGEEII